MRASEWVSESYSDSSQSSVKAMTSHPVSHTHQATKNNVYNVSSIGKMAKKVILLGI